MEYQLSSLLCLQDHHQIYMCKKAMVEIQMYFIPVICDLRYGHCWFLVILCHKNWIFSCGAVDKTPVSLSKAIVTVYYWIIVLIYQSRWNQWELQGFFCWGTWPQWVLEARGFCWEPLQCPSIAARWIRDILNLNCILFCSVIFARWFDLFACAN